jgi:hypothetical protein
MMSLLEEVRVTQKLNTEMKTTTVGRKCIVNKPTIRFTGENEDKIRGSVKESVRSSATKCYVNRNYPSHKQAQKALCIMVSR